MATIPGTTDEIKLVSHDGRDVRVDFGQYTMSPNEAEDFAFELGKLVVVAHNLRRNHENHVNLLASCALCRFEAGVQTDRLEQDDES